MAAMNLVDETLVSAVIGLEIICDTTSKTC